jgi:hypothetical protein
MVSSHRSIGQPADSFHSGKRDAGHERFSRMPLGVSEERYKVFVIIILFFII